MTTYSRMFRLVAAACLSALAIENADAASAQATVIYNFSLDSQVNDAWFPIAELTLGSDGNFYGTSDGGGAFIGGAVFKITQDGTETVLYSFGSAPFDGIHPNAAVTQASDGFLYGTTTGGGTDDDGTVFKISTLGAYLKLHDFSASGSGGHSPEGGLVQGVDGQLYGTTVLGGPYTLSADVWDGTLYRISTSGEYAQLYTFGGVSSDGQWPWPAMTLGPDGNLYGTTFFSGPRGQPALVEGGGTVFRLTPGGGVATIYDFGAAKSCKGRDGGGPQSSMILGADGNFYGVTRDGGAHDAGTIFKITPAGRETVLYSFGSIPNDGREPNGRLLQLPDGTLLGTTRHGGAYELPNNENYGGTAFMLAPDGTYTLLHSFGGTATEGQYMSGGLTRGTDGNFYGTTVHGGTSADRANNNTGVGTVFRLTIDPGGTAPTFHSSPVVCTELSSDTGGFGGSGGGVPLSVLLVFGFGVFWRQRRPSPGTCGADPSS